MVGESEASKKTAPVNLADVLCEELKQIRDPEGLEKVCSLGDKNAKLANVFSAFYKQRLSALCFSGGGIRSATFGLGVVQSLAEHGLLDKFDYLSTVSGGGYLGSWLSGWIAREKVKEIERLATESTVPKDEAEASF